MVRVLSLLCGVSALLFTASGAAAAKPKPPVQDAPVSLLPPAITGANPIPTVTLPPIVAPAASPTEVLQHWMPSDATALMTLIKTIGTRGLNPSDYLPEALQSAMDGGEGEALDRASMASFNLLFGDIRDGRTPKSARIQWLVKDTDAAEFPLETLMARALASKDIEGTLASIEPTHPEYKMLKAALAAAPAANIAQRKLIRANLDKWRWMPRKLADKHVYANIPEYMIRVVTYGKTIASYRSIVGKQSSQTPSLLVPAVGIVVHPPWVLPQSIIREEVGPMIARSPAAARARGYTWTGSGKSLSVIQSAGPSSALGFMKIDMPNPDAIFIHDTPSRGLFSRPAPRALSHGCVRTERAYELGILLGILQSGKDSGELAALIKKGKTEKVPFKEPIPVAITYFTYGTGMDGKVQAFGDIYGRDVPVIASLDKPRPVALPAVVPEPAHIAPKLPEAGGVI